MRTILERTNTEKGLRAVYIIAFMLLLLSYVVSVFNNKQLRNQAARVEHTNNVIKLLDEMLSRVKDAETGVRGYLIFRNISLLSPYFGSRESTDTIYQHLRALTAENPLQAGRLETLYADMKERFETLHHMIDAFNASNRLISDSVLAFQDKAEPTMNRIRFSVALMQKEENRMLNERNEKLSRSFGLINLITFISLILTVVLIVFGIITYKVVSKARKKGFEEILLYEQRLKQRIEELDKANAELVRMRSQEKFAVTGRIARTIAHEVRNPLTNINLATEQLEAEFGKKDENTTFLFNMITRNCTRINLLIADLLNSTKIPDLSMEKVKAGELIDDALRDAGDRIMLKNAEVSRDYDDNALVMVDRSKMQIALLNIVINAIEAMDKQDRVRLLVSTSIEEGRCKLMIRDYGPGMDEETLSRIFEPYFTSKTKGNGLGLTNTQNIILNHQGEITAESRAGEGTTFSIFLPLEGHSQPN